LLLTPEEIEPSSGLTEAVMAAIHRESSAPLPIQFPWKRVAFGPLTAVVTLLLAFASGLIGPAALGSGIPAVSWAGEMLVTEARMLRVEWLALAALVTLASTMLSTQLAFRLNGASSRR
jgi:hypothetical protein